MLASKGSRMESNTLPLLKATCVHEATFHYASDGQCEITREMREKSLLSKNVSFF